MSRRHYSSPLSGSLHALCLIMYCNRVVSDNISLCVSPMVGSVALLVARRTNDRKVAGSRPTKVVCITVLTTAWG